MVNNSEFAERLKKMMDYYRLTATALAESIDIQRSSISHLLSGRNKPSLDFVLKILETYPEVELYWLLKGEGVFPKEKNLIPSTTSTLLSSKKEFEALTDESIEHIIIFYKNGTFKKFEK